MASDCNAEKDIKVDGTTGYGSGIDSILSSGKIYTSDTTNGHSQTNNAHMDNKGNLIEGDKTFKHMEFSAFSKVAISTSLVAGAFIAAASCPLLFPLVGIIAKTYVDNKNEQIKQNNEKDFFNGDIKEQIYNGMVSTFNDANNDYSAKTQEVESIKSEINDIKQNPFMSNNEKESKIDQLTETLNIKENDVANLGERLGKMANEINALVGQLDNGKNVIDGDAHNGFSIQQVDTKSRDFRLGIKTSIFGAETPNGASTTNGVPGIESLKIFNDYSPGIFNNIKGSQDYFTHLAKNISENSNPTSNENSLRLEVELNKTDFNEMIFKTMIDGFNNANEEYTQKLEELSDKRDSLSDNEITIMENEISDLKNDLNEMQISINNMFDQGDVITENNGQFQILDNIDVSKISSEIDTPPNVETFNIFDNYSNGGISGIDKDFSRLGDMLSTSYFEVVDLHVDNADILGKYMDLSEIISGNNDIDPSKVLSSLEHRAEEANNNISNIKDEINSYSSEQIAQMGIGIHDDSEKMQIVNQLSEINKMYEEHQYNNSVQSNSSHHNSENNNSQNNVHSRFFDDDFYDNNESGGFRNNEPLDPFQV